MTTEKNTNKERVLVIAAAGTGGHVMPGLAVARVMKERGWRIVWIGTTTGMEGGLVEREGIEFHALNFQGVRGKGLAGAVKGGIKMLKAIWESRALLKKIKPDLVFSTGGYVAVPVGFAAQNLKRPIVLMNCDADLLMSTNTLMPFTSALACGFAGGARTFAGAKGHTTGNPVRAEIAALPAPAERLAGRFGPLRLFVFGGRPGPAFFPPGAATPRRRRQCAPTGSRQPCHPRSHHGFYYTPRAAPGTSLPGGFCGNAGCFSVSAYTIHKTRERSSQFLVQYCLCFSAQPYIAFCAWLG